MGLFDSIKLSRPRSNKFDLSHERKLSMGLGKLIPMYVQDVVPGDKFRVNSEILLRFAPLLAPIMHRVNVYTHYFFVPNRLVWDEWEDFITGGRLGTSNPIAPYMVYEEASKDKFTLGSLPDHMGCPIRTEDTTFTQGLRISALPFRAYQLIYDEYYRDQNLSASLDISKTSGAIPVGAEMDKLLTLRTRAWEKDYFTSALPFAQRGGEVLIPMESDIEYKQQSDVRRADTGALLTNNAGRLATQTTPDFDGSLGFNGSTSDTGPNVAARIENIESISNASASINELRRSIRLQEWLEKNARAGARYIEQILAHFGVRSSDARLQRPEYLGGGKNPVVISEVLQTTPTETTAETPLANMAGHGVSMGRTNGFRRFFEEHGYVIGIMSVVPKPAYQDGLPKHLARFDRFDYFWPEFANIGEQAVLNKELYFNPTTANVNDEIFGYQSRYAEYKYNCSSVHGDFKANLAFWHMGRIFSDTPVLNQAFVDCDGIGAPGDSVNNFDRVFATQEILNSGNNLWVQIYNQVDALRPMPYYGTPMI